MKFLRRTWAEISETALIHNLKEIKSKSQTAEVFAVVKANAYGHNARIVAPILEKNGADRFAVSNIEEALDLCKYGIKNPILVLGYTPVDLVKELADNGISQTVYSYEYASLLSESAEKSNVSLNIHIKFDTGMSRIGFDLRNDLLSGIEEAVMSAKLPNLCAEGVFTHFAAADSEKSKYTKFTDLQHKRFSAGVEKLKAAGITPELVHCDNSAALCSGRYLYDAVRPGIILYGLKPDREFNTDMDLRTVMALKSVVSFVKEVKPETYVSYGMTYRSNKKMKIATVAAGYADGYPRLLSNKGEVLIHGKRARIIGRICMDQMIVDVSNIDNVKMGDEVTLFGEGLPVDEIADICGTINYEIVCGVGSRVPRVLVE